MKNGIKILKKRKIDEKTRQKKVEKEYVAAKEKELVQR